MKQQYECPECSRPDPVLRRGYDTPKDRGWHDTRDPKCYYAQLFAKKRDDTERIATLTGLLERIRQWDHLDTAGDGAYWKREIDGVLAHDPQ